MEESNKGNGVPPIQESGAPGENGNDNSGDSRSNRDPGLERALTDLHKHKKQNRELSDQLAALRKQVEDLNQSKLQEKENWKEAFEAERKLREEDSKKHKSFLESTITDKKRGAITAAALKAGLVNEADIDFFPIDEVEVEYTTSGRIIVHGAESVVEAQKKVRPYLFKSEKPPIFNAGGARGGDHGSQGMSTEDYLAIKKKHGVGSAEEKEALQKWRKTQLSKNKK